MVSGGTSFDDLVVGTFWYCDRGRRPAFSVCLSNNVCGDDDRRCPMRSWTCCVVACCRASANFCASICGHDYRRHCHCLVRGLFCVAAYDEHVQHLTRCLRVCVAFCLDLHSCFWTGSFSAFRHDFCFSFDLNLDRGICATLQVDLNGCGRAPRAPLVVVWTDAFPHHPRASAALVCAHVPLLCAGGLLCACAPLA